MRSIILSLFSIASDAKGALIGGALIQGARSGGKAIYKKATGKTAQKMTATAAEKLLLKAFAKVGIKAGSKAALAFASMGVSLIIEALLVGGSVWFLNALKNPKHKNWVAYFINLYKRSPKWATTIHTIFNMFGYGDMQRQILELGVKYSMITPEEAEKLESDTSLFGDYFSSGDYYNVNPEEN